MGIVGGECKAVGRRAPVAWFLAADRTVIEREERDCPIGNRSRILGHLSKAMS